IDPGLDTRSLVTARIARSGALEERSEQIAVRHQVLERLETLPGVRSAANANPLPFSRMFSSWSIALDDRPAPSPDAQLWCGVRMVSSGYFRTLGIPISSGRTFEPAEKQADWPHVALVNETFAHRYWPGGDPVGHRILAYKKFDLLIIGVVADTRGSCEMSGCAGSRAGRLER